MYPSNKRFQQIPYSVHLQCILIYEYRWPFYFFVDLGSNSAPGLQGAPVGMNPQGTQTNPVLNQGASTNTQGTQTGFNAQGTPAAGGNSFNAAGGSQFGNNFGGGSNSGQSSFGFLGNQGK